MSLDSPSIASDTLSFAINLHPITDIPASGTSTARDFVATFQMNLGFAAGTTGLTQTGCTRAFGSEFTRTRDGGGFMVPLYAPSSEASLQSAGAIVANSVDATSRFIPGSYDRFAQLPESSSDALLVATVTCPIASSVGVAGVSFLGSGYGSNNKRLTTQDNGSYNQEVLTIASSNLLNYPLDGTTQHLTQVDIHSDGAGADLYFAQSVSSSLNNIDNAAFRLNSGDVPSYTSQVVDADTLRYRFGGGVVLSNGEELQITKNGDYYGISATTLTAIPYTFFADAPYITSAPTANASNTQVTVVFNTGIYNDPVSVSAFRLVLTTTSSAVSLATVSSVTTTSNAGEFVLAVDTENPATGTERFNVELVLGGIGASASPYRAAYPYQTTATNIAFNDVAPPVITVVSNFSNVNNVMLTVTDDDSVITTITYRRITGRTCDAAAYVGGSDEGGVTEGTSFSIGGPSDLGFSKPYCFRSVDAAGNVGFALNEPLDLISADLVTSNASGQITSFLGGIGQTDIWVGFSEEVSWRSSPTGDAATSVQTIPVSQLTVTYALDTTSTIATAATATISSAGFYPSVQVGSGSSPQALLHIVLASGLPLGIEGIYVAYVDATAGGDGIYDTAGDREIGNSDCGGTRTCNNETTSTAVSQIALANFATLDTDGDGLPDVFENSNLSADPYRQTISERTFEVADRVVALSAINQLPFSDGQKTDASLAKFYTHVGVTASANPALGRVRAPVVFDINAQPSGCNLSSDAFPANWATVCTQFDLASVGTSDVTLAWLAMDANGIWVVDAFNSSELLQNTVTSVYEVSFPAGSLYVVNGTGNFPLVGSGASGLKDDAVVALSPEDIASTATFSVSNGTLSYSGLTEGVPYRLGFNTTDASIWGVSEYTSSSTNPSLGEVSLGVPAQTYLVWDNGSTSNNAYGILAALASTLAVVGDSNPRFALQRNTTHTLDVTFELVGLESEGTLGDPIVVDSTNTRIYVGDLRHAYNCNALSAGVSCTFFVATQSGTFSLPVRLVQQVSVTDPDGNVSTQTAEFGNVYRVLTDSTGVVRDIFTSSLPLYVDSGTTLNMTFNIPQSSLAPSGFAQSFDIGAFAITTDGISLAALDVTRCAGVFGNCGSNEFAHNFQANGVVPGVLTVAGVANYRGGLVEVVIPLPSDQTPSRIALNKISANGDSTPFSVLDADGDWGVSARVSNVGGVCPRDTGIVGSAYRDSSGVLNRGALASVDEALCIFVQIRDGGANDLDGARVPDGIVIDPLGIDLDASGSGGGVGGGGGGGALGIPETVVLLLLALGALAVGSISRRRRNAKVY